MVDPAGVVWHKTILHEMFTYGVLVFHPLVLTFATGTQS
jgi:hypothetical protein